MLKHTAGGNHDPHGHEIRPSSTLQRFLGFDDARLIGTEIATDLALGVYEKQFAGMRNILVPGYVWSPLSHRCVKPFHRK